MSYMSFVAGGELSGGIKHAVGEMSDTRRYVVCYNYDVYGTDRQ